LVIGGSPEALPVSRRLTPTDLTAEEDRIRAVAHAAGVHGDHDTRFDVLRGGAGAALAAKAAADNAALLVLGVSRSHRIVRALVGSTTEYLLRSCPCPLVLCPDDPETALRLRLAATLSSSWDWP